MKLCKQCNEPFVGAVQKKFCSAACSQRFNYAKRTYRIIQCRQCHKPMQGRYRRRFCSDACRKDYEREYFRVRGVRDYHKNNPNAGYYYDKLKCMVCRTLTNRKNGTKYCQQPRCLEIYNRTKSEYNYGKHSVVFTTKLVLWDSVKQHAKTVDELFAEDFTPVWMQTKDMDKVMVEDLNTSVEFNYKQSARESRERIHQKRSRK